MKKLLLLFVLILLLTTEGFGQYNTLWTNNVSYVTYIRPDSVTMDASHFIFTPSDTLESFFQAGKPNPITPQITKWLWFYEFNNSLQLGDSVVIVCKLSLQLAPISVVTYLMTSFYNKNQGNAYFSEGKILTSDHSLQKYVWVMPKDVQQRIGSITTMSMDIQMGANPLMSPSTYVRNQVDMSDLKIYRDGKVTFHHTFQPLITGVEGKTQIPTRFSLSQNYPNPFNPATKIEFALPRESNVKLKIYNLLGQEVETLISKVMPAGNHTIDFDATKLPSGIYVYRIEAGDFIQSKKMLLMK